MESGTVVRVIRDFLTTTEGELCINAGEFLQVKKARLAPFPPIAKISIIF